ncbi:pectin acetylesterase-family hydrolase [Streptomyces sp. NPDC050418]|uniref:pectin acetylesterase-family hydrolase n=1 Tax=Streptomyces sp. NPDC050418 TaxID=3365612 RepID=UPI0037AFE61B
MRTQRRTTGTLAVVLIALALLGTALVFVLGGRDAEWAAADWKKIVPGGDCQCADGSEFAFWDRRADAKKVMLFLNGGGVCWSAETCAFRDDKEDEEYDRNLRDEGPGNFTMEGIFDFSAARNPFTGYSYMFVTSCTGDAHLGNAAHEYGPGLTVQHRGYVNGTAALDHLAKQYPDATEVVIVGKTAGSAAAPLYGGLVSDRLPDAKVTVLGGQSGAWPDHPDFNSRILDATWGAYDAMPSWAVEGNRPEQWGPPDFWVSAGRHDKDLVLSRFDFAHDPNAAVEVTEWMTSDPPDLLAEIDANETAIERAGVTVHSYTAPTDDHGIWEWDKFYGIEVEGVRLADWVADLASAGDDPPGDVHCKKCG